MNRLCTILTALLIVIASLFSEVPALAQEPLCHAPVEATAGSGWYGGDLLSAWSAKIRHGGAGGFRAKLSAEEFYTGGTVPWTNGGVIHFILEYDDAVKIATMTITDTLPEYDPVVLSIPVSGALGKVLINGKTSFEAEGQVAVSNVCWDGLPVLPDDSFSAQGNAGARDIKHLLIDGADGSFTLSFDVIMSWGANPCDEGPAVSISVEDHPTILARTGNNGSIIPSGEVIVNYGDNQTFTIIPEPGYSIEDVLVDSASVGAVDQYTFTDITASHTISASFTAITFQINADVAGQGQVSPASQTVAYGDNVSIFITPGLGCDLTGITDNGIPVAVSNPYIISNVTEDHDVVFSFTTGTYTITMITQTGVVTVTVTHGATQEFTFDPEPGYKVKDVIVDGVSQGQIYSYTFVEITGDHTVEVLFAPRWDVNCDRVGDVMDIVSVGLHWMESGEPGWIDEDINEDGLVDVLDIVIIGLHWGDTW